MKNVEAVWVVYRYTAIACLSNGTWHEHKGEASVSMARVSGKLVRCAPGHVRGVCEGTCKTNVPDATHVFVQGVRKLRVEGANE